MKAVILFSGGLDSTVALFQARSDGADEILAVSFNYGSKHAGRELEAAAEIVRSSGPAVRTDPVPDRDAVATGQVLPAVDLRIHVGALLGGDFSDHFSVHGGIALLSGAAVPGKPACGQTRKKAPADFAGRVSGAAYSGTNGAVQIAWVAQLVTAPVMAPSSGRLMRAPSSPATAPPTRAALAPLPIPSFILSRQEDAYSA